MKTNGQIVLDDKRNRIIDQHANAGKITRNIEYGVIRLMSEKHDREISFETAHKLKQIPPNFTGTIEIPELKLVIPRTQIVKIEFCERRLEKPTELGELPTQTLDLRVEPNAQGEHEQTDRKKETRFIEASVHYKEQDGTRTYYTELDKIPSARFIVREAYGENGHFTESVYKISTYGEIQDFRKA